MKISKIYLFHKNKGIEIIMTKRVSSFFKKHGLMMGIAIIVPGGEFFVLGRYLFKKYNKSSSEIKNCDKILE